MVEMRGFIEQIHIQQRIYDIEYDIKTDENAKSTIIRMFNASDDKKEQIALASALSALKERIALRQDELLLLRQRVMR